MAAFTESEGLDEFPNMPAARLRFAPVILKKVNEVNKENYLAAGGVDGIGVTLPLSVHGAFIFPIPPEE